MRDRGALADSRDRAGLRDSSSSATGLTCDGQRRAAVLAHATAGFVLLNGPGRTEEEEKKDGTKERDERKIGERKRRRKKKRRKKKSRKEKRRKKRGERRGERKRDERKRDKRKRDERKRDERKRNERKSTVSRGPPPLLLLRLLRLLRPPHFSVLPISNPFFPLLRKCGHMPNLRVPGDRQDRSHCPFIVEH